MKECFSRPCHPERSRAAAESKDLAPGASLDVGAGRTGGRFVNRPYGGWGTEGTDCHTSDTITGSQWQTCAYAAMLQGFTPSPQARPQFLH